VITPVDETRTTEVSLEVYVTPVEVPAGAPGASVTVDASVWVPPVWSVTADGWTARLWMNADVAWTVIVATATMFGACVVETRIVARPGATPRTTPFASTVAIVGWTDVNVNVGVTEADDVVADGVSAIVPPTAIVAVFGETVTDVMGDGAAETVTGTEPVTVWPFAVTLTVMTAEPTWAQLMVAPVPVPVTVAAEPLEVKVTAGVPVTPLTETPIAVVVP
jgi:hypothetical protein